MKVFLRSVASLVLDTFFPQFCCGCGRPYTYLCAQCFNTIDFISLPIRLHVSQQYIAEVISCCYYDGVIKNLIHTYKYDGVKGIGYTLAELTYYSCSLPSCDYITAVPLHENRLRERGFNQSETVARHLSQRTAIPFIQPLQRSLFTQAQADISDRDMRSSNVHNQFSKVVEFDSALIAGKSIIIVDDVCTTGSTLNECARVLKQMGTREVVGLTIAHGG